LRLINSVHFSSTYREAFNAHVDNIKAMKTYNAAWQKIEAAKVESARLQQESEADAEAAAEADEETNVEPKLVDTDVQPDQQNYIGSFDIVDDRRCCYEQNCELERRSSSRF
jgi:hypothetical protein